jgi:hypothetical protein
LDDHAAILYPEVIGVDSNLSFRNTNSERPVQKLRFREFYTEVPPTEKAYPIEITTVAWKLHFCLLGTPPPGVGTPAAGGVWAL